MDDLMGDKPFISPLATCSSTGKKKKGHYLNAVMKVAQVVMRTILQSVSTILIFTKISILLI